MINENGQKMKGKKKLLYVIGLLIVLGLILPVLAIMLVPGENDKAETGKQASPVATDALPSLQERMQGIAVSAENTGRGYIAYLPMEDRYSTDYIPGGKWAVNASDVRAMLTITPGVEAVGNYHNTRIEFDAEDGTAYKRYVTIVLTDMRTGEVIVTEKVYGGDPPILSYLHANSGKIEDTYGTYPEDKDIAAACKRMIADFEETE